jgi:hypothetical protein
MKRKLCGPKVFDQFMWWHQTFDMTIAACRALEGAELRPNWVGVRPGLSDSGWLAGLVDGNDGQRGPAGYEIHNFTSHGKLA